MKERLISIITVTMMSLTIVAAPVPTMAEIGEAWSSWSTQNPPANVKSESKTQYRYRNKKYEYSGFSNMNGYTMLEKETVNKTYGAWQTDKPATSIKTTQTGATETTIRTGVAWYAYAYLCDCQAVYSDTSNGKSHSNCTKTRNKLEIYSYNGVSYNYDADTNKSFKLEKRIDKSNTNIHMGLGPVYIIKYKGSPISQFTSGISNIYLWYEKGTSEYKKTMYRTITEEYRYKHWKWGEWSAWTDIAVAPSEDREVQKRAVYRYKCLEQTISGRTAFTKTYGSKPFSLGASAKTKLSYKSSNTDIATVSSDGVVTLKKAGTVKITVTAAENAQYRRASKVVTITVGKGKQSISGKTGISKTFGSKPFSLGASAKTKLTYKTSNKKIATVSSTGRVTVKNPGKAKITVKAAETGKYKAASKIVTINVKLKTPTLNAKKIGKKKVKLSWSKVPGATKYEIYMYDAKKKKFVKQIAKKANQRTAVHRGMKAGKAYKYKVRACRVVDGKKVYSAFSKVKKVKVK